MNERIKELVQHAVLAVDIVTGNEALDDELSKMYIPDCFAEKFAELIVKECMNLVTYVGHSTRGFDCCGHVRFTNEKIKEHFGVEE